MSARLRTIGSRVTSATLLALMLGLAVAGCGGGGGNSNPGPGPNPSPSPGPISTTSISVTGRIVTVNQRDTSKRDPVPGVTVNIRDTNISAVTDSSGNYLLANVPSTASQLVITQVPANYDRYAQVGTKTYGQRGPGTICGIPLPSPLQLGRNTVNDITLPNTSVSPPGPPSAVVSCPP